MLIIFVPSMNALLLIYLTIGFFVKGAPRALIAKIKSNQSQGREVILLKVLHSSSCLGIDRRVGAQGLNSPLVNHAMSFVN
jgi:hypothetical protein